MRGVGSVRSLGFATGGALYVLKTIVGPDIYLANVDPSTGIATEAPHLLNAPDPEVARESVAWDREGKRLAYSRNYRTLVIQNVATRALSANR